jgi:hypothetical protein
MQDIEELMQLAVDGAATPQQQAELGAALETSAPDRERFQSLETLTRRLDAVPMVDPPGVKPAVLAAIRPPARVRPFRQAKRWFPIAYAAAALLVIAVLVQHAIVPSSKSSATMMPVDGPVIARVSSPEASMAIHQDGDEFFVEAASSSTYAIEFDSSKLDRIGTNRFRRHPGATGQTVVRLRLPNQQELNASIDLR